MLCFILKWKGLIFLIQPYFWKNIHKFFFYSVFKFQMLDGSLCTYSACFLLLVVVFSRTGLCNFWLCTSQTICNFLHEFRTRLPQNKFFFWRGWFFMKRDCWKTRKVMKYFCSTFGTLHPPYSTLKLFVIALKKDFLRLRLIRLYVQESSEVTNMFTYTKHEVLFSKFMG